MEEKNTLENAIPYDNVKVFNQLCNDVKNDYCYYKCTNGVSAIGSFNGYGFSIECNSNSFLRVTFFELEDKTNQFEMIRELYKVADLLSKKYGSPVVYYDRLTHYEFLGIETINPTLEWCLNKENEDEFVRNVVNDCHLSDDRCVNVRPFTGKRVEYYKDSSSHVLKK